MITFFLGLTFLHKVLVLTVVLITFYVLGQAFMLTVTLRLDAILSCLEEILYGDDGGEDD